MIATYIKEIMHNMNCVTGECSMEIIYMFMVVQVSWLVESFNMEIFSYTINVINVKLCVIVQHVELYLFIVFSVTLTLFRGKTVLTENGMNR